MSTTRSRKVVSAVKAGDEVVGVGVLTRDPVPTKKGDKVALWTGKSTPAHRKADDVVWVLTALGQDA